MSEDDNQLKADELLALESIFSDDIVLSISESELKIGIPTLHDSPRINLHVFIPSEGYPSSISPVFELSCGVLDDNQRVVLMEKLQSLYTPGDVVLYSWISFLMEEWEHVKPPSPPPPPPPLPQSIEASQLNISSQKFESENSKSESRQHLQNNDSRVKVSTIQQRVLDQELLDVSKVVHGEPETFKKSTFQAHIYPATDPDCVPNFVEYLLMNNKIRSATHNIMAYRIESKTRPGTFYQDADDDGEAAAGKRLLHLLQVGDVRNVVVVVSRWFGGVLLGPARFGLINNSARTLLEREGYITLSAGNK